MGDYCNHIIFSSVTAAVIIVKTCKKYWQLFLMIILYVSLKIIDINTF